MFRNSFRKSAGRGYAWTNRDTSDPNHFYDLVNADGTLTPMGAVYAAWVPPSIHQVWLPAVNPRPNGYP